MADMFNKNELILDRVRSLVAHDLSTGELLFRLTSLEEPSLQCTAEGEEVTDAIGAVITTLYRAKKATFSATNSLISLDLAAAQYGAAKKVGGKDGVKIVDYTYEILTVKDGKVTLKHTPIKTDTVSTLKYVYAIVSGEIGTTYVAGTKDPRKDTAESGGDITTFLIADGTEGDVGHAVITLPKSVSDGDKVYVEYQYETEQAIEIVNKASEFPKACSLVIYAYFRDKCDENTVYSGKIICPRAKLNPEQVELALTSTGKHAFEFTMMKDYCSDQGEDKLFTIIVAQD